MFRDFYENPDQYLFQDADGNDITTYVLGYKDAFHQDSYETTDFLINTVRSVQETSYVDTSVENVAQRSIATKSKVWSKLKVYYTKVKYCLYSVTATYIIAEKRIIKAISKVESSYNQRYSVSYVRKTISSSGKTITYTIKHTINGINHENQSLYNNFIKRK